MPQSDLQKGNAKGCSSGRKKRIPDGSLKMQEQVKTNKTSIFKIKQTLFYYTVNII